MSYLNERPRKKLDLAALLHICPHCLGDLVERSDFAGEYYLCLQCGTRAQPRSRISSHTAERDYAAIRDASFVAEAQSLSSAA